MRRGMSAIQRRIDNRDLDVRETVITAFNPSPCPRTEVVTLSIDLPDRCGYEGFSLRDPEGNVVPFIETGRQPCGTLVRNLQDISLQLRSQLLGLRAAALLAGFDDLLDLGDVLSVKMFG